MDAAESVALEDRRMQNIWGLEKKNPKNPAVCCLLSVAFSVSMALRLVVSLNICVEFIT